MELTLFFAKFVAFEGIGVGRGMGMGSMSIYYFAQRLEENYFSSFFFLPQDFVVYFFSRDSYVNAVFMLML